MLLCQPQTALIVPKLDLVLVLLLNGRQNPLEKVKNEGGRSGCLSMVSFHCEVTLWHSGLDFLHTFLAQSSHRQ